MRLACLAAALMCATALPALAQNSAQATGPVQLPSTDPECARPVRLAGGHPLAQALAWVEGQNASAPPRGWRPTRATRPSTTRRWRSSPPRTASPRPASGPGPRQLLAGRRPTCNGVWRHTTPASYRTADPKWETLLDLDALSKAEGKNWILKGADCLKPAERLCLVHLSNGGGDAVEIREFDTATRQFVAGGFHFANGKQNVAWLDHDTLLVARDWGPGDD